MNVKELIARLKREPSQITLTVKIEGLKEVKELEKATSRLAADMERVCDAWDRILGSRENV